MTGDAQAQWSRRRTRSVLRLVAAGSLAAMLAGCYTDRGRSKTHIRPTIA